MPDSGNDGFTYIAFGAGVQSTALLVLSALGLKGVPKADCAIFADTGDEPQWVYDHLQKMRPWAKEHGITIHTCAEGVLSDDVLERAHFVPIPVYSEPTAHGNSTSQLRRQCTREYKITPIERTARALMDYKPRQRIKEIATAMIGISLDEVWRMKPARTRWVKNVWPLVDAGLRRGDCLKILDEHGIDRPGKSSCVYCPYHGNSYWRNLKQNYPEEWERAIAFDAAIRNLSMRKESHPVYVHRSLVPLAEADLHEDQIDMFGNECEGYCGV